MGIFTANGLYKPSTAETNWGNLVNANFDLLDVLLNMTQKIYTNPPTVLSSANTLNVGTGAGGVLLSSITGGIPGGATHALISVPAGGGNVYYTEDGSTSPVAGGPGLFVGAGMETEVTNLTNIKLISDAGTIKIYPSFRHY